MTEQTDKLQQFESELRAQHDALTATFTAAQTVAEAEWAKYEAAKQALSDFRARYGRVLTALEAKAITVA
jgi:hypothetical protein